ncbi:hypothetical protein ElyMa_000178000 [Elysia marginata]|uniref:Uncharacterized protein n=1 Tax=Elysia marginata TaxID=1093978 RepID=A0AAV4EWC5_9GAST|nr:hypothetical protein ElyMa_000178000 [Elysia marginata]
MRRFFVGVVLVVVEVVAVVVVALVIIVVVVVVVGVVVVVVVVVVEIVVVVVVVVGLLYNFRYCEWLLYFDAGTSLQLQGLRMAALFRYRDFSTTSGTANGCSILMQGLLYSFRYWEWLLYFDAGTSLQRLLLCWNSGTKSQ